MLTKLHNEQDNQISAFG